MDTRDRAFSVCAPQLWIKLPHEIRESPALETFNSNLSVQYIIYISFVNL